jgi:GH18 family chitinase
MTYDFHGSWDQNRAHHSSLNSKENEKDDTMYIVCYLFIRSFAYLYSIGFCG